MAQRLDRLPHGEIDDEERIVGEQDVRRVPRVGLKPPDVTRARLGEAVDRLEGLHEARDPVIVDRRKQASDVDLGEVEAGVGHRRDSSTGRSGQSMAGACPPAFARCVEVAAGDEPANSARMRISARPAPMLVEPSGPTIAVRPRGVLTS